MSTLLEAIGTVLETHFEFGSKWISCYWRQPYGPFLPSLLEQLQQFAKTHLANL